MKTLSHASGHPLSPQIDWVEAEDLPCADSRRLIARFPLSEQLADSIAVGSRVTFSLAASERVARDNSQVSEYLDLHIERSADVSPPAGQ